ARQGHRRLTPRRLVVRRAPAATAGRQDGRTAGRQDVHAVLDLAHTTTWTGTALRPWVQRTTGPDHEAGPGREAGPVMEETYGCKRLGRALPERRTRLVGRAEPVGGAGGGRSAPRACPGPGGGGGAQRRLAGEPGLAGGCP